MYPTFPSFLPEISSKWSAIYARLKRNCVFTLPLHSQERYVSEQLLFSLLKPILLIRFLCLGRLLHASFLLSWGGARAALSLVALANEKTRLCSIWAGQHMVRNEFRSRPFSPPGDLNVKKIENLCEGTWNLVPGKQETVLGSGCQYKLHAISLSNNVSSPPTNRFSVNLLILSPILSVNRVSTDSVNWKCNGLVSSVYGQVSFNYYCKKNRIALNWVMLIDNKCKHNSRVLFTNFKDYSYSNQLYKVPDRIIMVIKYIEA